MSEPLNQAVVKLWDHGHQIGAQIEARMRCDDHGQHQITDSFAINPNYVMTKQGLWLPYCLQEILNRFPRVV